MEWMEQKAGRDGDCVEMRLPSNAHVGSSKNLLKKSKIKIHLVKKNTVISKIHLFHVFLFFWPTKRFLKNTCPSSRTKRCFILSKASNVLPSWWVGRNHFVDSAGAWMLGGFRLLGLCKELMVYPRVGR